jgi:hypothetical protein
MSEWWLAEVRKRLQTLTEMRAKLDRQLSDPHCPQDEVAEITDQLISLDKTIRALRWELGNEPPESPPNS